MKYEATKILLDRLATEIHRTYLETQGKPSPDAHSAEFKALLTKADAWKKQICNIEKKIESNYGFLQVSYGSQKKLDWDRKQSLRSHMQNNDALMAKVKEILQEVDALSRDIIRGDAALQNLATVMDDALEKFNDAGCAEVTGAQSGGNQATVLIKANDPIMEFNTKQFANHHAFSLIALNIALIALIIKLKCVKDD